MQNLLHSGPYTQEPDALQLLARIVTRYIRCATASHSSVVQVHRRTRRRPHRRPRIGHKDDINIPLSPSQVVTGPFFQTSYLSVLGQVSYR